MAAQIPGRLDENVKTYVSSAGLLLDTTVGDGVCVSMKNYKKLQILIVVANGTTITAGDVTLKQSTAILTSPFTGEKALAFTRILKCADIATSRAMVETAVTANTFGTQTVNSKNSMYIIDVDSSTLDGDGGFDCVRCDVVSHASTNPRGAVVIYNLYNPRYSDASALVD